MLDWRATGLGGSDVGDIYVARLPSMAHDMAARALEWAFVDFIARIMASAEITKEVLTVGSGACTSATRFDQADVVFSEFSLSKCAWCAR